MADPIATFRRYFQMAANPYMDLATLYGSFEAVPALQPAGILATTESLAYPLPLLMANNNHVPILAIAPFSARVLPGAVAPVNKFAFAGDVSAEGSLPSLVAVTAACFHLTDNVPVLPRTDIEAAWTALPVADNVLPVPLVADNPEMARTRCAMPLPHDYAGAILGAYVDGTLSWRWLWTAVAVPIMANPVQVVAYATFLDYLRVASTARAGVPAGAADRAPGTELEHHGVLTTPAIQDLAMGVARHFLPGLRHPEGVGAQLNLMAGQQLTMQQALLRGQEPRARTLESSFANLYRQALRVCEVATETDLAPYWAEHPGLRSGAWLGGMDIVMLAVSQSLDPPMLPPIVSPALVTDVGTGRFVGGHNAITEGTSCMRLRPGNSPARSQLTERNRVYTAMAVGTGTANMPAVVMMMGDNEVELPEGSEQFRGYLEGTYVFYLCIYGRYNRAVTAFYADVVRDRGTLISQLELFFPNILERRTIFAVVLTYIFRLFNDYTSGLLSVGPATATGTPAAGAPAVPPFYEIRQALVAGRLPWLTTLPPGLLVPADNPAPAAPPALPRQQVPPAAPAGSAPGVEGRRAIERPDQNPQLKAAWRASGHQTVFGEGSPFRDTSQPNNRKLVDSDTQGKRICLPMALRGVCYDNCRGKHETLSLGEVRRVATAGNLQVEGL